MWQYSQLPCRSNPTPVQIIEKKNRNLKMITVDKAVPGGEEVRTCVFKQSNLSLSQTTPHPKLQNHISTPQTPKTNPTKTINMKFTLATTLLALTSSATASSVVAHSATNCGRSVGSFNACGDTGLSNFNVVSARTTYNGQTMRFFRNADCSGAFVSSASNQCINFPFRPLCARIYC